jgi:hypothetical protein
MGDKKFISDVSEGEKEDDGGERGKRIKIKLSR